MSAIYAVWVSAFADTGEIYAWKCSSCEHAIVPEEGTPLENGVKVCPKCKAKMLGEVPDE